MKLQISLFLELGLIQFMLSMHSALQAKRFIKSAWFFPAILLMLLITLTILQISGSSAGIYHVKLYGKIKDPALLLNEPQSIRSDEWLVNTQMTIAQNTAGYPRVNHNIMNGHDMSVTGDAPYKDWSAAFRPQNLVFFILPLAYAFAFKWWLLLFLVIISCYFVVLRFFAGKHLLAALISSAFSFSPFLFWWYQTITLAPIFYGFFILLTGMRIINNEKVVFLKRYPNIYSQILYITILGYLLAAFGLVLYPPFQIPVVVAVAAFLAGYFLDRYRGLKQILSKASLSKLGFFVVSALLAGLVVFCFIHTRNEVISSVRNTIYPGARRAESNNIPAVHLFSTYLQPQLEHQSRAVNYYTNQSEASNFLLFLPFLILPGFLLLVLEYRQKRKLNWTLLAVQSCACLFLVDLFVGELQPLYKLFLLDEVPHARLFIGLGFLGILQLLCVMKSLATLKISVKTLNLFAGSYAALCLIVLAWAGQNVRSHYPNFIHNIVLISLAGLFFNAIVFCFLSRRFLGGACLFFIFSVGCVAHIHPLYRGLDSLDSNKVFTAIDKVSRPGDTWVTVNSLFFENFASMANRNSLSGIQPYPDLAFWRQIEGSSGDDTYNRYAHVLFRTNPPLTSSLHLVAPDRFQVQFACTPFIEQHVQFALAIRPLNEQCVDLVDEVHYPALTFYLYKVR